LINSIGLNGKENGLIIIISPNGKEYMLFYGPSNNNGLISGPNGN